MKEKQLDNTNKLPSRLLQLPHPGGDGHLSEGGAQTGDGVSAAKQ